MLLILEQKKLGLYKFFFFGLVTLAYGQNSNVKQPQWPPKIKLKLDCLPTGSNSFKVTSHALQGKGVLYNW